MTNPYLDQAVYPRVYGERSTEITFTPIKSGLSPRIRGTAERQGASIVGIRFIPAYTGNGFRKRVGYTRWPVYPRVYGERVCLLVAVQLNDGLSPRIRGTGRFRQPPPQTARFIPAYTGNGGSCSGLDGCPAVYPRVYGERQKPRARPCRKNGLSPRIRGTVIWAAHRMSRSRFIPAYTGNGETRPTFWPRRTVYPRVYGERGAVALFRNFPHGLSPRIRGTVFRFWTLTCPQRFIPAYTGNGTANHLTFAFMAVYPRVYGERSTHQIAGWAPCGLSPRIRGTDHRGRNHRRRHRFIPAYTGNGAACGCHTAPMPVYPRVYGERLRMIRPASSSAGLSPRIRGTGVR